MNFSIDNDDKRDSERTLVSIEASIPTSSISPDTERQRGVELDQAPERYQSSHISLSLSAQEMKKTYSCDSVLEKSSQWLPSHIVLLFYSSDWIQRLCAGEMMNLAYLRRDQIHIDISSPIIYARWTAQRIGSWRGPVVECSPRSDPCSVLLLYNIDYFHLARPPRSGFCSTCS